MDCQESGFAKSRALIGGNGAGGLLLLAMTLAGCSGGPAPPPTVQVSGTVTYNGQPLTSGQVLFQPEKALGAEKTAELVRPAVGIIGADGHYTMSSFGEGTGVLPGDYVVAVVSYADEPTPEEYAEGAKRKSAIPDRYSSGITSGLKRQVAEGSEPHVYNIELKD